MTTPKGPYYCTSLHGRYTVYRSGVVVVPITDGEGAERIVRLSNAAYLAGHAAARAEADHYLLALKLAIGDETRHDIPTDEILSLLTAALAKWREAAK